MPSSLVPLVMLMCVCVLVIAAVFFANVDVCELLLRLFVISMFADIVM